MPGSEWGSFNPQSTVPSSASAAGAMDTGSLLDKLITPEMVRAAATPIAGAHAAAVPTSMQRPVGQHQDTPFDTRPVVGAGNARARGIGNAITGVTNALGNFVTKQAQVKQDALKDSATKVIQSQTAIDDAQQQLEMAKQDGDTATVEKMTQIIEQNKASRDAIFAGKHGKDLAKGFDFSYTDPEANKTEYHAAVQAAIKDAKTTADKKAALQKVQQDMAQKRGANMGEAYAKSQPQGLAANTTAQARLATAMQVAKDNIEIIKATSPERVADINRDAKLRTALTTQATELSKQQMAIADRTATRQANFAEREKLLGINDANITKRMYLNNQLILSREKQMIKFRMNNPDQLFKDAQASALRWDTQQRAAQQRLDSANFNLTNMKSQKMEGTPEYARQQALVAQAEEDLSTVQDQADFSRNQYNYALATAGVEPIPGQEDTGVSDGSDDGDGSISAPGTGNNFTDYFGTNTGG